MEGGASWFTDLTVADTTFLLPAMAFGVFLLSAELGGADGMQGQPPHVIQRFKWTMRVLTVIMVPFSKGLPAVHCPPPPPSPTNPPPSPSSLPMLPHLCLTFPDFLSLH